VEKLRDELRVMGLKESVSLTKNEQALEKIGVLELEVANMRREAGDTEDAYVFGLLLLCVRRDTDVDVV
jgi:hypothetical protein